MDVDEPCCWPYGSMFGSFIQERPKSASFLACSSNYGRGKRKWGINGARKPSVLIKTCAVIGDGVGVRRINKNPTTKDPVEDERSFLLIGEYSMYDTYGLDKAHQSLTDRQVNWLVEDGQEEEIRQVEKIKVI